MRKLIRRYLPSHEAVHGNRWLAPFANTLLHPRLWHLNRHSAAGAVAVGLYCGLIPGPLQMLGAAICCILFRVNLPLALFTTLYTNPFTIVPLYLLAVTLGQFVLGGGTAAAIVVPPGYDFQDPIGWMHAMSEWAFSMGRPLFLGLILIANLFAISGYFSVKLAWRWHLIRAWHSRKSRTKNELPAK